MESEDLNKEFKNNGFKVPENYFESFDASVLSRINRPLGKMTVWHSVRKWSIAASIFIAAGVGVFLYSNHQKTEVVNIAAANISEVELEDFRSNVEVSDDELLDLLSTRAVDSIYNAEIIAVSHTISADKEIESIEEEYSPLDDEIEI